MQKKKWFSGILGVLNTANPSKYLGIEFGKMSKKREFFQSPLDKIQHKLVGWKAQHLSQGGRLTLIKSTLASIRNYNLACFKAPSYICKKIDKII